MAQTREMVGGIETLEAALAFLEACMDAETFGKLKQIKTETAVITIANAAKLCTPEAIFINTGNEEDKAFVRKGALDAEEEASLPMPNHSIHYDLKDEQGRITDRTFYLAEPDEKVSSLANRIDRSEGLEDVKSKMAGIMKGMTMIVGLYMRGPVGAFASNPSLQITSSFYVSHSAEMLYRNRFYEFDAEVERLGYFYTNLHSQGLNRTEDLPDARVYMDRHDQTTYSINCTYAGNTLLMKKGNHRFSVDKAVKNRGNELSEHMFITGIEGPESRVTWFAGAAPSGCGKTTTAMAGHHFVGDDLAQMWIAEDGTVRSINPEAGIFGIVEDVNWEGDPGLMPLLREEKTEVIWSNVLIDEEGQPQWTGNGDAPFKKGKNFQGAWEPGMVDEKGGAVPPSHPNARATLRASALANYAPASEDPNGVETSVITYSGRDADTMPPVWVAKNSDHGVAIGACIVSAATATEVGASGVKRAPWANAPFIPGALGEYMDAQFKFWGNTHIADGKRPLMAGLNYFLTHEARGGESKALLGEKRDVKVWLGWLERRFHGEVGAIETPIGFIPEYEDLKQLFAEILDKPYTKDLYNKQFSIYVENIVSRIDLQAKAYGKEEEIPSRFFEVLAEQREGLLAAKASFGPVVNPAEFKARNAA
ncbi:MAG: phosphoenolpyruvate carboxykinase (GTP) [Desulfobacterales bacterium]|nr:phosphoenolpyruvate carboxykinase (GTP) [Desulfobacterales bacterium]